MSAPPSAPAALTTDRLSEMLAIFAVDLVEAIGVRDRRAALEALANRLDGQGRTANGSSAAQMLGAVGHALMRLEG